MHRSGAVVRRLAGHVALAAAAVLLPGCAVQQAARGVSAADLGVIRAGASRADIETRLGHREREWQTPAGVTYRVYRYFAGVPGSKSGAGALVLGEIATLGLLELIMKGVPDQAAQANPANWRRLAVAYDAGDIAVGVFIDVGDFTALPADGRPREQMAPSTR